MEYCRRPISNLAYEVKFLLFLWRTSLAGAMEYRTAFLSQAIGMILNDGVYFVIWILFFDRFKDINGWGLTDMYLVFGVSASSFGFVSMLFGNTFSLGEIISRGRLDYYLSFPRHILPHLLASRMIPSGFGDFIYGFISFSVSGHFSIFGLMRFILGVVLASIVFMAFLIAAQSLTFWTGTGSTLTALAVNAMVSFALYPVTIFNKTARLVLFLVVPAAFMGAVPAGFVKSFSWSSLGIMLAAAIGFVGLSVLVFRLGLRRYESGSGIQVEV